MNEANRTTLAVAASAGFVLATLAWYSSLKKHERPPPPSAPVNTIQCIQRLNGQETLVPSLLEWAEHVKFASAMTIPLIPTKKVVMLTDANLAKEILTDPATTKPPVIYNSLSSVRGMSMASQIDNVKWKHARKGSAPAFSGNHIRRMNDTCHHKIDRWIADFIEPLVDSGEAFDPCDGFLKLTVSVIFQAGFDYEISEEENRKYLEDIGILSEETNKRITLPIRSWFHRFLPERKQVEASLEHTMSFCQRLLDEHRKSPNPTRGTILDLIANNPHYKDDAARARDIDIFILAGFDTTGYTLSWAVFELAKRPKEADKLRNALLKLPEAEHASCAELMNVANETLRLYPTLPMGSTRTAGRDFVTSDGCIILKDTIIFQGTVLTQRNPKIFGDDAHIFRPDRWNDATEEMRAALAPFSMGPRNCIGQALAKSEIHTVLAKIVPQYRLELVKDFTPVVSLTFQPKGGKIKLTHV